MPNFIGFSTINRDKKFTIVDINLVKRDLLNAFSIKGGTLPGRPEVGTKIWDYIFDPSDSITSGNVEREVRRIIEMDARIELHDVVVTSSLNTITAYITLSLLPAYSAASFYINFLEDSQTATIT